MNEQIGVTYFPVLGGAGYHMAVFYTNRAGETSVIEVGPADASLGPVDLAKALSMPMAIITRFRDQKQDDRKNLHACASFCRFERSPASIHANSGRARRFSLLPGEGRIVRRRVG